MFTKKHVAKRPVTKRILPALVASTLALTVTGAQALTFSGLYVFGDSLSDTGYFRPALAAAVGPTAAAGLGRFTTNPDPVWSELIAQYYGGNAAPANAGGGIYAQGGAQALGNAPPSRVGPLNQQRPSATQVTEYLTSTGGRADPNALYGVWFGANDIFTQLEGLLGGALTQAQVQTNVVNAANTEVGQIARLQAAGARYILVFALPDIGTTPAFATNPASASVTAITAGYNTTLFNALAATNTKVIPVDTFTLLAEVRANPSSFGFTNITTPACLPIGSSAITCSAANIPAGAATTYLYADPVHPTSGAHAIVGDFVKSLIDGPNAYGTMAEIPLGTRGAHIRTLDAGLRTGQLGQIGRVAAFAAGDGGKYDIATNRLSPSTDSKNRSATVGVTFRASDAMTFGLALGKTTSDATIGSIGKFETNETLGSAFGSFKSDGLYANFSATIADLKFDNIRRNVKLGSALRVNNAETKGSNASANFTVGYDFALGAASVGPFLSYTTQSVTVNSFSERNGTANVLSTDLKIGDQDRTSRITSLGARASVDFGKWTPFARVSVDQESNREERVVTATPLSLTQGLSYSLPAYRSGRKWGSALFGVRASITDQLSFSASYGGTFSRTNVKEDGFTANIAYAF
jgi:outer membrane lipase/esterase